MVTHVLDNIAGATILLHDDGLTVTRYGGLLPDIPAYPEDTETYRKRARDLGYGEDTFLMSREHELAHHLLAHSLALPYSPTLHAVAMNMKHGTPFYAYWAEEENAVLALQLHCRKINVSIVESCKRISESWRQFERALDADGGLDTQCESL